MLKLSLALLVLLGTSSAQEAHPLSQLEGTTRILMVFAPDANSANFKRQLELIQYHSFELSSRNTVVVPVSTGNTVADFEGEVLPLSSISERSYARSRYHVAETDFTVLLLNEDGAEAMRSAAPVNIYQLVAKLDAMPQR